LIEFKYMKNVVIKAVIFDFGGVIRASFGESWTKDIANAYNVSEKLLLPKMQFPREFFRKGIINENQFWEQLSLELNKPIPKNKNDLWRRGYEKDFYIYPEMINFVKKIKKQNFKTAILSNTIQPYVEIIRKHKGYEEFDVVVLSCEAGLQKPEQDIYLLTTNRLKVGPEECVFIDDLNENLGPAKELGMQVVLAQNPKQVIDDVSYIIKLK